MKYLVQAQSWWPRFSCSVVRYSVLLSTPPAHPAISCGWHHRVARRVARATKWGGPGHDVRGKLLYTLSKPQKKSKKMLQIYVHLDCTAWQQAGRFFSHVFTRKGRKQMRVHGRHQRAVSFGTVFVAVVINACCLVHLSFHIALVTFPSTFFRNMLLYQATRVGGLPPTWPQRRDLGEGQGISHGLAGWNPL